MSAFSDGEVEVLRLATIIESGLDVPSPTPCSSTAPTASASPSFISCAAGSDDRRPRAYAYLVTPPERQMTVTAEKRLKVLSDLDSLGAGFQLASHDLDIRDAGD